MRRRFRQAVLSDRTLAVAVVVFVSGLATAAWLNSDARLARLERPPVSRFERALDQCLASEPCRQRLHELVKRARRDARRREAVARKAAARRAPSRTVRTATRRRLERRRQLALAPRPTPRPRGPRPPTSRRPPPRPAPAPPTPPAAPEKPTPTPAPALLPSCPVAVPVQLGPVRICP